MKHLGCPTTGLHTLVCGTGAVLDENIVDSEVPSDFFSNLTGTESG